MGHRRRWADIRGWWKRPVGATATEYLVLLVLGILVVLAGIQIFGGGVGQHYDSAVATFRAVVEGESEEDIRQRRAEARQAHQEEEGSRSASARSGEDEEDGSGRAVHTGEVDRDGVSIQGQDEEASGSVGGVNPFVGLILVMLVIGVGILLFSEDD